MLKIDKLQKHYVWLAIVPLIIMAFSMVFGVTVNLKFHRFDWDKKEQVVKQRLSALLGGFAGFLASVLAGGMVLVSPTSFEHPLRLGICAVMIVLTVYLYQKNQTVHMETL